MMNCTMNSEYIRVIAREEKEKLTGVMQNLNHYACSDNGYIEKLKEDMLGMSTTMERFHKVTGEEAWLDARTLSYNTYSVYKAVKELANIVNTYDQDSVYYDLACVCINALRCESTTKTINVLGSVSTTLNEMFKVDLDIRNGNTVAFYCLSKLRDSFVGSFFMVKGEEEING